MSVLWGRIPTSNESFIPSRPILLFSNLINRALSFLPLAPSTHPPPTHPQAPPTLPRTHTPPPIRHL
ncbi:hypothetical protein M430DRAFT_245950 [Amorphotheca resinae ATCC 22711]|uniref:Uncharacterized protein n=1 Tax=Amorphotheca resinae ATCC 22711 TaxID=857342 RepID=A0A2T3AZI6_AMORE|nr:hypothetical protein M430DRAFT_245950 [Amorphotheca resinae ATCC 22711]PSS16577.1 hypothetical protein M430DRAFT_245950 [Amorphotheca resinae ATCC 22711]